MPKQLYKITQFHGGLNSNSDARDIAENELSEATDVMVDELGKIRLMGGTAAHVSGSPEDDQATGWDNGSAPIIPGYGLFYFSHDRTGAEDKGSSEAITGDDYLAIYDGNDGQVWIYSRVRDTWDDIDGTDDTGVIDIGSSNTTTAQVNFYTVDGAIRVCDGNFANSNTNQWYGYINRKHFVLQDLSSDVAGNNGDTLYTYSGWYAKDQELAAPTRGLLGGLSSDVDVIVGGDSDSWSITNTPRLLQGTATGGSTTTVIDNDATGSNGAFHNFLASQIDGKGYILVNNIHDEAAIIDEWVDEDTLSMDPAMPSNAVDATDLYTIFPTAGTGFNILVDGDDTGTFNVSGSARYYTVGVSFVYDGSGESEMYEYNPPRFIVANNSNLNMTVNCTAPFDPRISGARVYIKEKEGNTLTDKTGIWYLLMDIDMTRGARADIFGDNYSGWVTTHYWGVGTNNTRLYLKVTKEFSSEPTMTRESVVGYNFAHQTTSVRYKTAVVANRRTYIGNVQYIDRHSITHTKGDAVIKSPVNQFDAFPTTGLIETSVNDGDNIVKLEEYADRLLIFKKNKLDLLNISQEIEFLEDTFMYKGVSHPAATCKTDYGIAWVNRHGCYLYDGQKVNNLLEKQGRQIIKESEWFNFLTPAKNGSGTLMTPMIGYLPKKRQLIVFDDITTNSTADPRMYLYDMVTQSWTKGTNDGSNRVIDIAKTNFITDWNGDLVYAHTAGTVVKWDDVSDASAGFDILTKDIDFGHPGQVKRIYGFHITYKCTGDGNISLGWFKDGSTAGETSGGGPSFVSTSARWSTISLSFAPYNCYSLKIHLSPSSGDTTPANFEINDITVIYRLKGMR